MIVETDSDRAALRVLLTEACAAELADVGVFLVKLMIRDRASNKYGVDPAKEAEEYAMDVQSIIVRDGWRGLEAVEARIDEIVDAIAKLHGRACVPTSDA
ncbi:MAG: hypothetical protein VB144_15390 [Clostridia bacterium]|nr:hypothetical protein [Clostridia bacterium]